MPHAIPTLMEHLKRKYAEHLAALPEAKRIAARTSAGFFEFCENYLDGVPVTQVFYPGRSIGFVLADSTRVVACRSARATPAEAAGQTVDSGGMQPSHAVPITNGKGLGEGLPR